MATRKKKATRDEHASGLEKALKFVSIAQASKGEIYQRHVVIQNNMMVASDGVITAGHPIPDDVSVIANSAQMMAALKQCKEQFSIEMSQDRLKISSGKFTGYVDCLEWGAFPTPVIAQPVGKAGNALRDAMGFVQMAVDEKSSQATTAAIHLTSGTATGTDGKLCLQYWHGYEMPPQILIAKPIAKACNTIDKEVVGFGYNGSSFSIWFDDHSFIQSQCLDANYSIENINALLNKCNASYPIPLDFFEGLKAMKEFTNKMGTCRLKGDYLEIPSETRKTEASTYKVEGLPTDGAFNLHYMRLVEGYVKTIEFGSNAETPIFFAGENCRGALAKIKDVG